MGPLVAEITKKILEEGVKIALAIFALWGTAMSIYASAFSDSKCKKRIAGLIFLYGVALLVAYICLASFASQELWIVDILFLLTFGFLFGYHIFLIKAARETIARHANPDATKIKHDERKRLGIIDCDFLINAEAISAQGMEHLRTATKSFDMLAVAMTRTLANYTDTIRQKAANGVQIRILLLDPEADDINRLCEASFGHKNGTIPVLTRDTVKKLADIIQKTLPETHKTNIKVKLLTGQVLYSMWIADSSHAHLQPFFYRGTSFSPAIRTGDADLIRSLEEEFRHLWGANDSDNANSKLVDLTTYKAEAT